MKSKKEIEQRLTSIVKERRTIERKLHLLMEEDRTPFAQNIIDRMFTEFKTGGRWTNKMKKMAEEKYYVYSPIGRKRNLFAAMTGDKQIVSQQVRRGSNAPIQGFASEIGVKAGRLVMETYYTELPILCELLDIEYDPWALKVPYNRMVHDANYYSVPYSMVIPFIHILQYCVTYGITKAYKEQFNIEFTVEPEISIDVGIRDDLVHEWDWAIPNLVKGIVGSVTEGKDLGLLGDRSVNSVIKEIFKPWANSRVRKLLQANYPLLGVTDLNEQITSSIRPLYEKPAR